MSSHKPEFPPLLGPGLHPFSWLELRAACVDAFPLSQTRLEIFTGLEEVIRELQRLGITGELWLDGSFLTRKIDPDDIDLVLGVPRACY